MFAVSTNKGGYSLLFPIRSILYPNPRVHHKLFDAVAPCRINLQAMSDNVPRTFAH